MTEKMMMASAILANDLMNSEIDTTSLDFYNADEDIPTVDVSFQSGNRYHMDFHFEGNQITMVSGFYFPEGYPEVEPMDFYSIYDAETIAKFDCIKEQLIEMIEYWNEY